MDMTTDFERYGFAQGKLIPEERSWLLTVDFEAFQPATIPLWSAAMDRWAEFCRRGAWKFSFFIAVEDVVRLRVQSRHAYQMFLDAVLNLHDAGARFFPHNHCVFDPDSGRRPKDNDARSPDVTYPKRPSLYYDVAYRNKLEFRSWAETLFGAWQVFLSDARIPQPSQLAFRAGGWDHGVTLEDITDYLDGLVRMGVIFDSSASSGVFETGSWRVGARFGTNTFRLNRSLIEVAPCDFVDCGAPASAQIRAWVVQLVRQRSIWPASLRRRGALVTVLHFDHLFHSGSGSSRRLFAVESDTEVERRIKDFFTWLPRARRLMGLTSLTFDELTFRS